MSSFADPDLRHGILVFIEEDSPSTTSVVKGHAPNGIASSVCYLGLNQGNNIALEYEL